MWISVQTWWVLVACFCMMCGLALIMLYKMAEAVLTYLWSLVSRNQIRYQDLERRILALEKQLQLQQEEGSTSDDLHG